MPAPKQITNEQRQQIVAYRKRGYTLREVSHAVGVSLASISRILRAEGIHSDPTQTLEASRKRWEAAQAAGYSLLADLLDDIENLRARCYEPYRQWISTPEGPVQVELPEPPLSEVAKLMEQARRIALDVNRLQKELDEGTDLDKTRGFLGDLFEQFKMVAALAEPINEEGTYDSDYDVETDPEQR